MSNESKNMLSIEHDDDDENLEGFEKFLDENTYRKKHKQAEIISELGDDLISEIEEKKRRKLKELEPQIKYILKKSNKYTRKYLEELDYRDIPEIYNEIKEENKSFLKKFIDFLSS